MKRAYLKCIKKEGEDFKDEYVVKIDLFNGWTDSAKINIEDLGKKGDLKVNIIEDYGEKALIILPKRFPKGDTALVSTENLNSD